MDEQKYLLVIQYVNRSVLRAVANLRTQAKWTNLEIVVLAERGKSAGKHIGMVDGTGNIHVELVDFDDPKEIRAKLRFYENAIVGVVCRGDKRIQYLRKVVPILPSKVRVASLKSLEAATNKLLMREAFTRMFPEISPRYLCINQYSAGELAKIESSVGYPLIVKPTDLASSLLVQAVFSRDQLDEAVKDFFKIVPSVYRREERHEKPRMIAEEYLEGDFYSIDAYVLKTGDIYFCPPLSYVPAKKLGVDDFFIYKRSFETNLQVSDVEAAEEAARKALVAIGLSYSSAHIELVNTLNGWKIIELGPRLGRFRDRMYGLAYGIDHALNDVKVHLGIKPDIPTRFMNHCAGYCIYPLREGRLQKIAGIDWVLNSSQVLDAKVFVEPGAECYFAKHGGHVLAEFIVHSPNTEEYLALTGKIEKTVCASTRRLSVAWYTGFR
jgi:hypothetical protein